MGRSIEQVAQPIDRLDGHPRLGVCLDSCHLWASGADVTDARSTRLDEFERLIGFERLRALHVNDSVTPLGSNRDCHEPQGGE